MKKYLRPDFKVIALETSESMMNVSTIVYDRMNDIIYDNPTIGEIDAKEHGAASGSLWNDIQEEDENNVDF